MPKSCNVCSAVASPDIQLRYCDACQSALYCSKTCQRIDWRQKQHRQMCKLLNVGRGDMQVRTETHTSRAIGSKEKIEEAEHSFSEDMKRFFKLFEESTLEGSRAAARKMKQIAKRKTKQSQEFLLFHCSRYLVRFSNSEMLSWPNSPLLVMLQFVDSSAMLGTNEEMNPLHFLAELADPFDDSTHENQLILTKQFIEHGANVRLYRSHGAQLCTIHAPGAT